VALPNIHCLLDRHVAITAFTDLIDGHMAHMPFAQFAANSAWALCATIAHNLRRAAARGALRGTQAPRASGRRTRSGNGVWSWQFLVLS